MYLRSMFWAKNKKKKYKKKSKLEFDRKLVILLTLKIPVYCTDMFAECGRQIEYDKGPTPLNRAEMQFLLK